MRLRIERDAFDKALRRLVPVLGTGYSGPPVTAGIRIAATGRDLIELCATDIELMVQTQVVAQVVEPGVAVIPGKLLAELVKGADGETVELDVSESSVEVASGECVAHLATLDAEAWPQPRRPEADPVALDADVVADIGRICFAVDRKPSATFLKGVWFHNRHAVATDSYRLAAVEVAADLPEISIPAGVWRQVVKESAGADLILTADANSALLDTGTTSWTTRLLPGVAPAAWQRLIPETGPTLTVERAALLDAVSRVAVLTDDQVPRLRMVMDGDKLRLSAGRRDVGDITDLVAVSGSLGFEVCFDSTFFRESVAVLASEEISIVFGESDMKPVAIHEGRMHQALMPARTT